MIWQLEVVNPWEMWFVSQSRAQVCWDIFLLKIGTTKVSDVGVCNNSIGMIDLLIFQECFFLGSSAPSPCFEMGFHPKKLPVCAGGKRAAQPTCLPATCFVVFYHRALHFPLWLLMGTLPCQELSKCCHFAQVWLLREQVLG